MGKQILPNFNQDNSGFLLPLRRSRCLEQTRGCSDFTRCSASALPAFSDKFFCSQNLLVKFLYLLVVRKTRFMVLVKLQAFPHLTFREEREMKRGAFGFMGSV